MKLESGLIMKAQCGDQDALATIAEAYRPLIRAHAFRMLHDHDDANDVTQDTFVKAFRAIKSFDSNRPLLPWLMRICSNCCVDIIRNRKHRFEGMENHEYSLCDTTVDIGAGAESKQESEVIKGAITRLPDRYREIIVMRHYRHMDVNEIADALNKPEGTVKSWLFRARAMLKKDLSIAFGV